MIAMGLQLGLPYEISCGAVDVPISEDGWLLDENGDFVFDENGEKIPAA